MGNSLCGKEYYYYIILLREWEEEGEEKGMSFPLGF